MRTMISLHDAMTVVSKQLPDEGITFREFMDRTALLLGGLDPEVMVAIKELVELEGISEGSIIKTGSLGTKLN